MSFDEHYRDGPELLEFYRQNLLEPGWYGELSPEEFAYVEGELQKSASFKRRWGFRPSARRLNEQRVRRAARDGL